MKIRCSQFRRGPDTRHCTANEWRCPCGICCAYCNDKVTCFNSKCNPTLHSHEKFCAWLFEQLKDNEQMKFLFTFGALEVE